MFIIIGVSLYPALSVVERYISMLTHTHSYLYTDFAIYLPTESYVIIPHLILHGLLLVFSFSISDFSDSEKLGSH